ncbi:hypothetical protein ACEPAF_2539 [Sanghuangporus sanghuang]
MARSVGLPLQQASHTANILRLLMWLPSAGDRVERLTFHPFVNLTRDPGRFSASLDEILNERLPEEVARLRVVISFDFWTEDGKHSLTSWHLPAKQTEREWRLGVE